jgi:hypothetical protein
LRTRRPRLVALLNLGRQSVDRFVEEVDVRKDLGHDQRVFRVEAALERIAQRRDLLAHLALGEVG